MAEFQPHLVTGILNSLQDGDSKSSADLLPVLYQELRNLAHGLMSRYPTGQTLQPTALVHEAYLRLQGELETGWDSRGHFFGAAAQTMRRILVDQARRKAAAKHGGKMQKIDLDLDLIPFDTGNVDILALDQALDELKSIDERKVNVVLLRFLTGLTISETAKALGVSEPTVNKDWRFARIFLYDRLHDAGTIFKGPGD